MRMLAEVAARLGRYADAEKLLARCLELAPGFTRPPQLRDRAASPEQGRSHSRRSTAAGWPAAQSGLSRAEGRDARPHRRLRGDDRTLSSVLEISASPKAWMSYGHALKTAGRNPRASTPIAGASSSRRISARRSGASPISRRSASRRRQTHAMRAQLARRRSRRRPLSFRLRARQGARGRGRIRGVRSSTTRRATPAAPDDPLRRGREPRARERSKRLFTPEFFAERAGCGCRRAIRSSSSVCRAPARR